MRRLPILLAAAVALLAACLPFKDDGLYACNTDTGEDCVTCDAATGWCRDITAIAAGTTSLRAIHGVNSSAVWAVGRNGVIVRWNGSRWVPKASGTTEQLNSVWAADEDDVFAAGSNYTWLHDAGSGWSAYQELTLYTWPWGNVDGTYVTAEHFTAVGGKKVGSSGVAWTLDNQGMVNFLCNDPDISDCSGLNWPDAPWQSNNYWYLMGVVQDGMVAKPVASAADGTLMYALWTDASYNTYFVGNDGAILRDTDAGTVWADMQVVSMPDAADTSKKNLYAIWGDVNTGSVFVVGAQGTVVRLNQSTTAGGATWSTAGVAVNLWGVCGTSETDVWAVGDAGTLVHWNGSSWAVEPQPYNETLWGIYCTAGDLFVITDAGAILHKVR